ncbi:MAG: hypothetical protein IAI50_19530, partial [Candidatus Eremiobacteraeota bacterium]|nr:hypothetical protein [Candidatus Eremiobacteraeota bacterium]
MYDRTDDRGVPISAGIPPIVVFAGVIGVIVILTIISIVFSNSGFGHAWP